MRNPGTSYMAGHFAFSVPQQRGAVSVIDLVSFIKNAVMVLVPMILSLTVHEFAHAWASAKLGDNTAESRGRLNLNPLSHIDPVGTVALPLMLLFFSGAAGAGTRVPFFGWAKPVPVDPSRFTRRISVRTGMMLVAAAGPLSNFVMAVICAAFFAVIGKSSLGNLLGEPIWVLVERMFSVNIALMVFNLIPVYPLDGQKVVSGLLSPQMALKFERFNYQFGTFLLLAVIFMAHRVVSIPYMIVRDGILTAVGIL